MNAAPDDQLVRLASDNQAIYQDAWQWFLEQGRAVVPILLAGLKDDRLGLVCHWRILLVLRELALPSTLPAILEAFHDALARRDPIVLPGAIEALAAFRSDETAISALISVLKSDQPDAINHAAALLGEIGSDRAVDALRALLDDERASARQSAVRGLLKVNSERAKEILNRHRRTEKDAGVLKLMHSRL